MTLDPLPLDNLGSALDTETFVFGFNEPVYLAHSIFTTRGLITTFGPVLDFLGSTASLSVEIWLPYSSSSVVNSVKISRLLNKIYLEINSPIEKLWYFAEDSLLRPLSNLVSLHSATYTLCSSEDNFIIISGIDWLESTGTFASVTMNLCEVEFDVGVFIQSAPRACNAFIGGEPCFLTSTVSSFLECPIAGERADRRLLAKYTYVYRGRCSDSVIRWENKIESKYISTILASHVNALHNSVYLHKLW